jgi:glycolate oxidase
MQWVKELLDQVGEEVVSKSDVDLDMASKDHTEDLKFIPDAVAFPRTTDEVAAIMKVCHQHRVPVTTRGAGTGLSGAALPIQGGLVISTQNMNQILDVDTQNYQMTVQPGVINQVIQDKAAENGLMYPPDPASKGSSFIGGNIAHSSGGPKAVKYGTTKDYILNCEVVLPSGDVIWTGSNTLKNSTGYNLTQLMVGSEGTLGIITQAVLKLIPAPKHQLLMLASFPSLEKACEAVPEMMSTGVIPSAMELMEASGIQFALKHLDQVNLAIPDNAEAFLLVEVDGNHLEHLQMDCETLYSVMEPAAVEVLFADDAATKEMWWKIRRSLGEVVKRVSIYKEEDTVVKRSYLPDLMRAVKEIGREVGFESVCYGHAGDGNLHVNILKGSMSDEAWNGEELEEGIRRIFRVCKQYGGTISGEHGIGYVQKKYLNEVMSPTQIDLLKGIKSVFDPLGILNPGKIWT